MKVYLFSILWDSPSGEGLIRSLEPGIAFTTLQAAKDHLTESMLRCRETMLEDWVSHPGTAMYGDWHECQTRDDDFFRYHYRIEELTVY